METLFSEIVKQQTEGNLVYGLVSNTINPNMTYNYSIRCLHYPKRNELGPLRNNLSVKQFGDVYGSCWRCTVFGSS